MEEGNEDRALWRLAATRAKVKQVVASEVFRRALGRIKQQQQKTAPQVVMA